MKTTKILSFGLFMLVMLLSTNTFAQKTRKMPFNHHPAFSKLDANGDGFVSKEEFMQARAQRMSEQAKKGGQLRNAKNSPDFGKLDLNGDGKLSKEEFAKHQVEHRNKMQKKFQKRNKKKNQKKNQSKKQKQVKNKFQYQKAIK